MKIVIEAWHQPDGRGYGWAPCHGKIAGATWFLFAEIADDESRQYEFKTRRDAEAFAKRLRKNKEYAETRA